MKVVTLHGEAAPTATFAKSSLIDATRFLCVQFGFGYPKIYATGWEDMVRLASDQPPSATFTKEQIQ